MTQKAKMDKVATVGDKHVLNALCILMTYTGPPLRIKRIKNKLYFHITIKLQYIQTAINVTIQITECYTLTMVTVHLEHSEWRWRRSATPKSVEISSLHERMNSRIPNLT